VGVGNDVARGGALRLVNSFTLLVGIVLVLIWRGLERADEGILVCSEEFEIALSCLDFRLDRKTTATRR